MGKVSSSEPAIWLALYCREKPRVLGTKVTVPQTNSGGYSEIGEGGRENLPQGTRQIYPVTSGKGVPLDVIRMVSIGRPQRMGQSDCLTKTQVSAKGKPNV